MGLVVIVVTKLVGVSSWLSVFVNYHVVGVMSKCAGGIFDLTISPAIRSGCHLCDDK